MVLACLETLFVAGLIRNPNLAKPIQNMALGRLKRLITDKAQARRIALLSCGRFDPSSKTCHRCGHHHAGLTLSEREWTCPSCQAKLDRDTNAAINIFIFATGGQPGVYIERGALRIGAVRPGDGLEKPAPDDRASGGESVQTAGVPCPRLSGGKQGG